VTTEIVVKNKPLLLSSHNIIVTKGRRKLFLKLQSTSWC